MTQTLTRSYGFREVEVRGRQMFVNGQEVKFRGFWGGDSPEQLRSLNVNHTRQKWATEAYLNRADAAGLYVLDENSVDFAKFGAEVDPQYARQWLALVEDKLERDWNHPSVVMWGLGNESFQGPNILATHRYVKAEDPQRPTMFSWANRIGTDEPLPYDIYSFHYAPADADVSDYGVSIWHSPSLVLQRRPRPRIPVLVDEATHVCISMEELTRDPNVRNFWEKASCRPGTGPGPRTGRWAWTSSACSAISRTTPPKSGTSARLIRRCGSPGATTTCPRPGSRSSSMSRTASATPISLK